MIPVFETALVEDGRIRLRERHRARLAASGGSAEQVAAFGHLLDELETRAGQPFTMRIDISDDGLVVSTRPPRATTPVELPIKHTYDPSLEIRRIKIADRSWVEIIEAEHGGAEVLLVSRDHLVGETTRASIIALRADGALVVPHLRGILQSVTRGWAIEQTGASEANVSLDDLYAARGAAVLTAGRGVIPIHSIEGRVLARDPLFDDLQSVWRALP